MRTDLVVRSLALLSISLTLAAVGSATFAADPVAPHVAGEVVVRFTVGAYAGLSPKARPAIPSVLEPFGVSELIQALPMANGAIGRRHGLDRVYRVRVAPEADVPALAAALERLPAIEYAHPNYLGRGGGQPAPLDTHYGSQWPLENTGQGGGTVDADIDAPEGWQVAVGRRETIISVLDSGVDSDHIDLRPRLVPGGFDFVAEDFEPEADHPHGVAVSGVITAQPNNRFVISGVDWRSRLRPVKVLNSANLGTTTDLAQGILLTAMQGVDVSNQSLINYPNVALLSDAVTAAHEAGVIQIGCNGNSGGTGPSYPAAYSQVVATGWTDRNDLRSPGSNHNGFLDVVAPGVDVPTLQWGTTSDIFASWGGCSFATPQVSGIAGVLLSLDPTLTQEQMTDILRATAEDEVGNPGEDVPGRDDFFGWGRVNLKNAVDSLGLVSQDFVHVDEIALRRLDPVTLEIQVTILDDLTGLEAGVLVDGTLALPGAGTLPLSATTGPTGTAVMTYAPGGTLPAGSYTFTVDGLTKSGFARDVGADVETERTHDPDLNGLHVASVEMRDDFTTLTVDVQVLDDDDLPEGGVIVKGSMTPPVGPVQNVAGTSSFAAGGVARFTFGSLTPGLHVFDVTQVQKSGFIHEPARDVEVMESHDFLGSAADFDSDGITNGIDNCVTTSNASQSDADADGIGDACDGCPNHGDPSQRDTDGDGTGDRCDCAPYDPAGTDVGEVRPLLVADDGQTLEWPGVAGADFYDVLRGPLSDLDGSDYGSCLADDVPARRWTDADDPPAGAGFFYLVRADDATCGAGTLGDGAGLERANGNPLGCN